MEYTSFFGKNQIFYKKYFINFININKKTTFKDLYGFYYIHRHGKIILR